MHYIHVSPFIATIKSQENNDEVAKTTRWLLKMVFYIKENEGVSVFLNLKLDILNKLWSFSVDGKYGDWSEFNKCSVSCGGGTQRKTRACNNPAPAFGGRTCEGPSVVTQSCNTHHCPGILLEIIQVL